MILNYPTQDAFPPLLAGYASDSDSDADTDADMAGRGDDASRLVGWYCDASSLANPNIYCGRRRGT